MLNQTKLIDCKCKKCDASVMRQVDDTDEWWFCENSACDKHAGEFIPPEGAEPDWIAWQ